MKYNLRGGHMMSILEYIEYLIEQGYTEEQAERCAELLFNDDYSNTN